MTRPVFLKAQNDLLTEIEEEIGSPTSGGLWTKKQIYRAISNSVELWAGKVLLPRLYYFETEYSGQEWYKAIPSYIRGPVNVQVRMNARVTVQGVTTDDNSNWASIYTGELEVDDESGQDVVFRWGSQPYAQEGRVFWYSSNGPVLVPTHDSNYTHTVATELTSLATDYLTINGDGNPPLAGWLKVGDEIIAYSGLTSFSGTLRFTNLVRGCFSTTQSNHEALVPVYIMIGVDDNRLWQQLKKQAMANLHEMKLHRGGLQDRRNHQEMVNHLQAEADAWWKKQGYTTQRDISTYLSQYAVGRMPWF